jgi:hypothetical protein
MIDLSPVWLVASALWIAGVVYGESLDGLMLKELGEVIPLALLPPIVPPLMLFGLVRILANMYRP